MHLTNYSVNKYNVDYQVSASTSDGEKSGSKRSLKYLFEYLRAQSLDATTLWKDIQVGVPRAKHNLIGFHSRILLSKQSSLLNLTSFLPIGCVDPVLRRPVKVFVLKSLVLTFLWIEISNRGYSK